MTVLTTHNETPQAVAHDVAQPVHGLKTPQQIDYSLAKNQHKDHLPGEYTSLENLDREELESLKATIGQELHELQTRTDKPKVQFENLSSEFETMDVDEVLRISGQDPDTVGLEEVQNPEAVGLEKQPGRLKRLFGKAKKIIMSEIDGPNSGDLSPAERSVMRRRIVGAIAGAVIVASASFLPVGPNKSFYEKNSSEPKIVNEADGVVQQQDSKPQADDDAPSTTLVDNEAARVTLENTPQAQQFVSYVAQENNQGAQAGLSQPQIDSKIRADFEELAKHNQS